MEETTVETPEESKQEKNTEPAVDKAEGTRKNFSFFAVAALLYAVFHVFCLWGNYDGIMTAVWTVGLTAYILLCIQKFGWKWKKSTFFYGTAVVLLGISTFLTRDGGIIVMNYLFIIAAFAMLVIREMCEDRYFGIMKYAGSIFTVVFAPIGFIIRPFIDWSEFRKENKGRLNFRIKGIIIGTLAGIPILAVIVWLLADADMVFSSILLRFEWLKPETWLGKLFYIFCIFILAYGAGCCYESRLIPEGKKRQEEKKWEPTSGITFTTLLAIVYLFFCGIQVMYLFVGGMRLPEGYSYAQYAREGYFQLFVVCLMNLIILIFCRSVYRTNRILQILLAVISGCTYIMIASSMYRMILYVENYGLSTLRVLVLWSLAVLTIWMAGVFLYIWKDSFPLFRFGMAALVVLYLVLAFGRKDYVISWYNLNVADSKQEIDIIYLTRLSEDAAPAIGQYYLAHGSEITDSEEQMEASQAYSYIRYYFKSISSSRERGIRSYNASEAAAKKWADKVLKRK